MPAAFLASLLLLGGQVTIQTVDMRGETVVAAFPADLVAQIDRGTNLLDESRFEEAIQVFNAILARVPDHGPTLANRAMAYALTNRLPEATRDVDAAARVMPDVAAIHRVRAIIANRRSDAATELAEFSRSLELEPDNPLALHFRAHLYQNADNHEAALADADAYIAARPQDPEGHVLKADLLIRQRQSRRAEEEAVLLVTLFPENPEAHASAARIFYGLANRNRALTAIDEAILRAPDNFQYRVYRAGIRRWNDLAGRRADLDAALAFDPGNNTVITRLGLLDFKERKWSDAIARFSSVLALEPRDFGVLAYRAMAHLNAGDRALAERDFRAASAAASGADDFSRICAAFGGEGFALDWAMESCNRAIQLDATQGRYRAHRGLVELRLGRLDAALADYNAAIEADGRLPDDYYGRALVHLRRGEREAAKADRRQALAIDPAILETYQAYGFADF